MSVVYSITMGSSPKLYCWPYYVITLGNPFNSRTLYRLANCLQYSTGLALFRALVTAGTIIASDAPPPTRQGRKRSVQGRPSTRWILTIWPGWMTSCLRNFRSSRLKESRYKIMTSKLFLKISLCTLTIG